MKNISVPLDTIQKIASFISASSPALEKSAAETQKRAAYAPLWVDRAVASGIVHPSHRDSLVASIAEGDTEKLAALIDKALDNVRVPSLGQATEVRSEPVDVRAAAWDRFAEQMKA